MTQEIEIEFKTVLTKADFHTLAYNLPFPKKAVEQTNYYFDTKDFALKKHRSAIRIRQKDDAYVLTLKQPYEDALLETHELLSKEDFMNWVDNKPVTKGKVAEQLHALGIDPTSFVYYGYLTTYRQSFIENDFEYVLDESHYNGIVDYELELEAPSIDIGEKAFESLINKYRIQKRDPITKIERFFQSLPQFLDEEE